LILFFDLSQIVLSHRFMIEIKILFSVLMNFEKKSFYMF
jgi:hypothetical protein